MSSAPITAPIMVGSYDDAGTINSFDRTGMTPARGMLEIQGNVYDAFDDLDDLPSPPTDILKKAVWDIRQTCIKLIENGKGMDVQGATNLASLKRENHASKPRRGVSGWGAKAATYILSCRTEVLYFTRQPDGEYLCIRIPWHDIYSQQKWLNMIEIRQMTADEKAEFIREREENGMISSAGAHGTTIRFLYNVVLSETILANFAPIKDSSLTNPLDRMGVVFGKEPAEVLCKDYRKSTPVPLKRYNYFGQPHSAYYMGRISSNIIEQMVSNQENIAENDTDPYRFVWKNGGEDREIRPKGKGRFAQEPSTAVGDHGYTRVGDYIIHTALLVDPDVFNLDSPKEIVNSAKNIGAYNNEHIAHYNDANDQHLSKESKYFMACAKLVRNGQIIGLIPPEANIDSARANKDAHLSGQLVQVEIVYSPRSNQRNHQDRATNTQENKNQHDGASVTKKLTRLVYAIKKNIATEILNYFENLMKPAVGVVQQLLVGETAVEEQQVQQQEPPVQQHEEPPVQQQEEPPVQQQEEPTVQQHLQQESHVGAENDETEEETSDASETVEEDDAVEEQVDIMPVAEDTTEVVEEVRATRLAAPSEVNGYRRGVVTGEEMLTEMQRIMARLQTEAVYQEGDMIQIFNMLRKMFR